MLCVIGPTPTPARLQYIQATNARKHIADYLIHARAMRRLHPTDNAAATGGVHMTRTIIECENAGIGCDGFAILL
ncbi:hypothetical protein BF95_08760 [Sphingobium sp. Ant17]|nr:hypothetical protein BF95_08760 [Sphingobium sp. Ant17]